MFWGEQNNPLHLWCGGLYFFERMTASSLFVFIRLLAELADASEVQGVSGAQTPSEHEGRENTSTGATQQFAAAVELCKKSIGFYVLD